MAKVKYEGNGMYSFYCPGCKHIHVYYTVPPHPNGAKWSFNGDINKPSFSPSLLNRWGKRTDPKYIEPEGTRNDGLPWSGQCHLYVTGGKINYCGDCTHDHNGRHGVEMREVE